VRLCPSCLCCCVGVVSLWHVHHVYSVDFLRGVANGSSRARLEIQPSLSITTSLSLYSPLALADSPDTWRSSSRGVSVSLIGFCRSTGRSNRERKVALRLLFDQQRLSSSNDLGRRSYGELRRHGTYDIRHRAYDIRHRAYRIYAAGYEHIHDIDLRSR
jgi:hypothetical protein